MNQTKRDIDKFFKRLKRHAHKAEWTERAGHVRARLAGSPVDDHGGICPISFLANSCGQAKSSGGKFTSGDVWIAADALGIVGAAAEEIVRAADRAGTPRHQRLLRAVGL